MSLKALLRFSACGIALATILFAGFGFFNIATGFNEFREGSTEKISSYDATLRVLIASSLGNTEIALRESDRIKERNELAEKKESAGIETMLVGGKFLGAGLLVFIIGGSAILFFKDRLRAI